MAASTPGAAQSDDFELGSANAQANVMRVGATTGGLQAVITLGQSIAKYNQAVGQGQSRTADLAVIGVVLGAEACDGGDPTLPEDQQPPTVRVDARDEGSAKGTTLHYLPGDAGTETAALGTQHAEATEQPYGHAVTEIAPIRIPGLIEVKGGTATATTQIRDGREREALAVSQVGQINLLGGLVRINGLRWEARQITDTPETEKVPTELRTHGEFRLDSITVLGQTIELDAVPLGEIGSALEALNPIIEPTGLVINWPDVDVVEGQVVVTPLRVAVDQSSIGRQVVGPLLELLQPVRDVATEDVLFTLSCRTQAYVLIADVAIGVPAGSGALLLELGGVQAFTEGVAFADALAGRATLPASTPAPPAPPAPAPAPLPPAPAPIETPSAPSPDLEPTPAVISPPSGSDGGAGLIASSETANRTARALLILGALLTLAVAGADLLKVRRARLLASAS